MNKSKTNSAEKSILEAAKNIFLQKGMDGARMQEIADEAGINKSMLHYYFRSKELLFKAVFMEAFSTLAPQLNEILNAETSICDKIKEFSYNYINFVIAHPYLPNFILQEMNRNEAFIHDLISKKHFPSIKKFKLQVEEKVADGTLKPIKAAHLFINIMALNIFPFVASPLLKRILKTSDKAYQKLIEERKTEVSTFIINAIKL
jgi:AcrR family transcriptional regulator